MLLGNGDAYSFGRNTHGQLGLGDTTNRYIPTRIESLSNVKAIACDFTHSLVLLENDDIYAFERNYDVQLGLVDTTNRDVPVKIDSVSNISLLRLGIAILCSSRTLPLNPLHYQTPFLLTTEAKMPQLYH